MTRPTFAEARIASVPGSPDKPSEDWGSATPDLVVVLDGATARTDTGCIHGVRWYAEHLGSALVDLCATPDADLTDALAAAIERVAQEHPECDLTHPGTPSAGVAILRADGRYLVLGDVTIVTDGSDGPTVIVDSRVEMTGRAERDEVDRHLVGTPEKAAALIPMKRAELAARNVEGGYWIAAADPSAAKHALIGTLGLQPGSRAAILTDGAARAATFGLLDWVGVLDLLDVSGPDALLQLARAAENDDPQGARWPRNKVSDDATSVAVRL